MRVLMRMMLSMTISSEESMPQPMPRMTPGMTRSMCEACGWAELQPRLRARERLWRGMRAVALLQQYSLGRSARPV